MGALARTAGARRARASLSSSTLTSRFSGSSVKDPLARSQLPSMVLSMVSHRPIGRSGGCGSSSPSTVAPTPFIT
ncbi:Uncharacterised protein [Bordetella pertussis]|nr:Uncharacterised protein [Bordetella pertussis]CFM09116.1 Uncharacterised protein [Bordetella pertussis]CFM41380.1 Uncharacterised protein [Bordetella pertussis]CFM54493.1 Uncharacterised protein [Bordetella pertussis]CFM84764.1 Uncharacterised protein [Bordetella pertussis]